MPIPATPPPDDIEYIPADTDHRDSTPNPVEPEPDPAPDNSLAVIDSDAIFTPARSHRPAPPQSGIQGLLYKLTGGLIALEPSAAERALTADIAAIQQDLDSLKVVSIMSAKGGRGKTPASISLCMTLAKLRAELTLLLEVNPDGGTFKTRLRDFITRGMKNMIDLRNRLRENPTISTDELMRHVATDRETGMQFMFAPTSNIYDESSKVTGDDLGAILDAVRQNGNCGYKLILTDGGTSRTTGIALRVIEESDVIVFITNCDPDTAQLTADSLASIALQGPAGAQLVQDSVIMVVQPPWHEKIWPSRRALAARVTDMFRRNPADPTMPRTVVEMPFDQALASGQPIGSLQALKPATRRAYVRLAAEVMRKLTGTTPAPADSQLAIEPTA